MVRHLLFGRSIPPVTISLAVHIASEIYNHLCLFFLELDRAKRWKLISCPNIEIFVADYLFCLLLFIVYITDFEALSCIECQIY